MTRVDPSLIERLVAELRNGPPMRLAMLFGSAARGDFRSDSDLDVAIWPLAPELPLAAELGLQSDLARVFGRDVDLVRLDRAPTLVRWKIAQGGIALVQSGPFESARFVADAASDYLEFAPALERAAERFRKKLASGAGFR